MIENRSNNLKTDQLQLIADARHHDPFAVLGYHNEGGAYVIRLFLPYAEQIELIAEQHTAHKSLFARIEGSDFFELHAAELPTQYKLNITNKRGEQLIIEDIYRFGKITGDVDLHLFAEGTHRTLYQLLGAHQHNMDDCVGTRFTVWAPSAKRISVVGPFNEWDGRTHCMRSLGSTGLWELFIPDLHNGELYKFEILNHSGNVTLKQDPYANEFEMRPNNASKVFTSHFDWQDQQWVQQREKNNWQQAPCSIYEVHLGSWQRDDDNHFLNYQTLAHRLVDYVKYMGFTHIELLPITEHPLDDSWGYQVTGYFAPTSRFGSPDDFRYFINHCHQSGIGVILDWVPAHFPRDDFSLAQFDGTALYEHADPRQGEHRDWGTLIFNYGRTEVRNFLINSALYWCKEFHIDGLRVDAVASMLYLDYSREADDWLPNQYGGRENLEAIDFLQALNSIVQTEVPGALVIAEESTSWPQVSRPTDSGGLGFTMKWNMGWMHDTLSYMQRDAVHRQHHHNEVTFGLLYAFTENFVLPYSHDEVVHGKGSMLTKMAGDDWQQFANLRLLYSFQFTYPGKKLLFQGTEFAQRNEWDFRKAIDWHLADATAHRGVMTLVQDLNRLYKKYPALHECDFNEQGYEWIYADDAENSVLSYSRYSNHKAEQLIVLLNFTPVPRDHYAIGVDKAGTYIELFNSDSERYGGSNYGNFGSIVSFAESCMDRPHTLAVKLPPLAVVVLQYVSTPDDQARS